MSLSPGVTMLLATALWTFLRALLFGSAAIALENLALRHQLVVLQRAVARPRLTRWDRIFWVWLSRLWASWRSSLVIVQPTGSASAGGPIGTTEAAEAGWLLSHWLRRRVGSGVLGVPHRESYSRKGRMCGCTCPFSPARERVWTA